MGGWEDPNNGGGFEMMGCGGGGRESDTTLWTMGYISNERKYFYQTSYTKN